MSINIYVGNLSYNLSESELEDLFTPFGDVMSAKLIVDRYSGNSKGFGFIEMNNRVEGQNAIDELNGKEINGRTIRVNEARPRDGKSRYGKFRPRSNSRNF